MAPTDLDDYLFDLRGYLVLEGAVEADLVHELNVAFDSFPALQPGEWWGNSQRLKYFDDMLGFELHNCVEAGEPFERLIDHPSWIDHMRRYCGEQGSYVEGLFIDETVASIRPPGGHHPVHSGGYQGALRGAYHYANGVFRCGQVNVIVALTDIGVDDGATMVVPGSHKANFRHPLEGDYARGDRMDDLPGAVRVPMHRGDALLFVDGLMHGAGSNTGGKERRVVIYRYGPSWGATRFGYQFSPALLARVTKARRRILQPIRPIHPPSPPGTVVERATS